MNCHVYSLSPHGLSGFFKTFFSAEKWSDIHNLGFTIIYLCDQCMGAVSACVQTSLDKNKTKSSVISITSPFHGLTMILARITCGVPAWANVMNMVIGFTVPCSLNPHTNTTALQCTVITNYHSLLPQYTNIGSI